MGVANLARTRRQEAWPVGDDGQWPRSRLAAEDDGCEKTPMYHDDRVQRIVLGSLSVLQVDEMVAKATIGDDGVFEAVYWRIVASLGCVLVALAMKDGRYSI